MTGQGDKAKGRVEEAIGDLTDDKDMKRRGKADKAAGGVKDTVEDTVDKVRDKLNGDR